MNGRLHLTATTTDRPEARGLGETLHRTGRIDRLAVREWLRATGVPPHALPKDLTGAQWVSL
ncbi:hypothetical protein [Planotetraspora phitsanulokensis]|uniref:hypothetical protein n=1 Tax=Planotetraspora phitsanulokensis TaxID=575192 RepID=UPI001951332B|nr:hypothetical protein [Planotetraspora phitsanulokensis]